MELKNPFKMWFLVPFAIAFTVFLFWMEIIRGETAIKGTFIPESVNSAIMAWGTQSAYDIAGQILVFQFICLGALTVWLVNQD